MVCSANDFSKLKPIGLKTKYTMQIIQIKENSERLHKSINRLLPQLSVNSTISYEHLQQVIDSENSSFFVAEDDNNDIVAMATLVFYDIPTGQKAWIEDVVVDKKYRGKGIGKKIVQDIIAFAKKQGFQKLDLTSSYEREKANLLYQKLGFQKRQSNLYRIFL